MSLFDYRSDHNIFSKRPAHVSAKIQDRSGIRRIDFTGIIQASHKGEFVDFMEVADEGSFSRPAQFFKITKEILPYVRIPEPLESGPIEIVIPDNVILKVEEYPADQLQTEQGGEGNSAALRASP